MKKITIIIFIVLNIYSCSKETCQIKMERFNFPEDIDRWKWDEKKYICEDIPDFIDDAVDEYNLKLLFNDKNYTILFNGKYTKFLFDKPNDLLLCFQTNLTKSGFTHKTIKFIYILDKNFFPLYSIKRANDDDTSYFFKYFYDNKYPELYSYEIIFKNFRKKISELNYHDLIDFNFLINSKQYKIKNEVCFSPKNHKIYPLWTGWLGITL